MGFNPVAFAGPTLKSLWNVLTDRQTEITSGCARCKTALYTQTDERTIVGFPHTSPPPPQITECTRPTEPSGNRRHRVAGLPPRFCGEWEQQDRDPNPERLLIALSIGCHSTQNSFSFGSVKNLSATVKGEVHGLIDPVHFPTSLGTPHRSLKGRGRNLFRPSDQTTLARICGLTFIFYSVLCSCGLSLLPNPNLTILFLSSVSHTG